MRSVTFAIPAATVTWALLLACNQDSAASNSERETHMGNVRAVAPSTAESASAPPPSTGAKKAAADR